MGTLNAPEVREYSLTPKERAESRDNYVRVFDAQWADWSTIAKVCVDMDRDRDWEILGFTSFNQYLVTAAPRSRSYLYLVIGRYKELSVDISDEELAQIPLGSAGVLKKLSPSVRRDPKVRKAARETPSNFGQFLNTEFPDQHIEGIIEQRLKYTTSQFAKIEAAYEAYKVVDESASWETFYEWLVSECQ